jgi:two-component system sensor histidine kinase YesM
VEANGDLLLRVEDDGVGMEPDILAEIRQSLKQGETDKSLDVTLQRHIGIMNVHHRIRYAYGGQYGITDIHSTPEQGTRVSVLIPARGDKDVHGSTRR